MDGYMFARKRDDGNYDILEDDGTAATRIDADVWPIGSAFNASYEHPNGIVLTRVDVRKAGIEIEDDY